MKGIKYLVLIVALNLSIQNGCDTISICPDEDWGNYELLKTSKELLANIDTSTKAVFLDSTGKEIRYTLYRDERFYVSHYNCDQNNNGIIDFEEPLAFTSHLEANNISYYSSEFYEIHLSLYVNYPANVDPLTKENFENGIYDLLTINIDAYSHQPTFTWAVDKRKGANPPPDYQVHYEEEITLNDRLFTNVYWDDKYLSNGISKYVIYFNGEFGIIGIRNTVNGYLLSFDHYE